MLMSPAGTRDPAEVAEPPTELLSAEPRVRAERVLRPLDHGARRLDRAVGRYLPDSLNPLLQLGAIANLCFLVAVATGVLLLFWYVPSVHQAHSSVAGMADSPWTAELMRSLHRYSSDACMLLVLVHAAKVFFARRFTGARWLSWVTGAALLGLLWLVGWLGYWLVWDQRGQQVALGTARMLDCLPIFVDPLSRSFLTDATVNSLLFFLVFFAHMLVPLVMGIGLWLHLARLARSRFLTGRTMSLWVLGSLCLVSLLLPADTEAPARMAVVPRGFAMDWWYLAPLALTDRLGGGALWALCLCGGGVFLAVPWWMRRSAIRPATVDVSRCNACTNCSKDCPYGAITMVPRTDGMDRPAQAQIDLSRCVGCGICAGSCDSIGIGLEWFGVREKRETVEDWLAEEPGQSVAFVCAHSAGGALDVEPFKGRCAELPGWRVLAMPCAGWLHALTVERALSRGAAHVAVVACAEGSCRYREGAGWARERLAGQRSPALRAEKVDAGRIHLLNLDPGERKELLSAAAAIRAGGDPPERRAPRAPRAPRARRVLATAAVVVLLCALTWAGSRLGYTAPALEGPELVVSFKHPGAVSEEVRMLSAEEQAGQPAHMRRDRIVERQRHPVRLRVLVDGAEVLDRAYRPRGIWEDGNSIAVEHLPVGPGEHRVEVAIGDAADPEQWTHRSAGRLTFRQGERRVVLFERTSGFVWPDDADVTRGD